jgi:hypothetical protein
MYIGGMTAYCGLAVIKFCLYLLKNETVLHWYTKPQLWPSASLPLHPQTGRLFLTRILADVDGVKTGANLYPSELKLLFQQGKKYQKHYKAVIPSLTCYSAAPPHPLHPKSFSFYLI